jgi:hypothetical protein
MEGRPTVTNNRTNKSRRQRNGSIGVKQVAHAIGMSPKLTRQVLRRKFGRHQSWDLWLLTEEQAQEIIDRYGGKAMGP